MEGTGWNHSHLVEKQVFGYQVFGINNSTNNLSSCYYLRRCPENGSKIDTAVELLNTLSEMNARVISQMDSLYTCKRQFPKKHHIDWHYKMRIKR